MKKRFFGLTTIAFSLCINVPAFAEVCDKIVPDWKEGDSPIRLMDPAYITGLAMFSIPGLFIIGICAFARWKDVGVVPAYLVLGGSYSAFLISLSQEDSRRDDVYLSAIREGCVQASDPSGRLIWIGLLFVFLAFLALTIRLIPLKTA